MKKFSDNRKGTKGFYVALGISAVMIGSACYFAYEQGEKMTEDFTARQRISEEAVDRKMTDIPKITTSAVRTEPPTRAGISVATAPPAETAPPVVVIPDTEEGGYQQDEPVSAETYGETGEETEYVGTTKLENVKSPLADMGELVGAFSGGELVKSVTTGSWQTHNGVDIAAEVGAEVYAVSNGEIISVENDPVWGVTVILDHHNGYMTKYCGLSDVLSVQRGDMLVSGDVIGTVGNTADIESAIAPHLHMEVKHNGSYIDPLSILK